MKKIIFTLGMLVISNWLTAQEVTLTHVATHNLLPTYGRVEICISDSGDFYVNVGKMLLPNTIGTKKHWVYHFDSLWNKLDSFPVTQVDSSYGEPCDQRAAIINNEFVIVYQCMIWKDTSEWVHSSEIPMDKNALNQSLMLARYSLDGTELFRGPIIANSTDTTITFSDLAIKWDGTYLLVNTGSLSPNHNTYIRKINITNADTIDTHIYTCSPAAIPGPFGNSIDIINDELKVFSYTPPNTTMDIEISTISLSDFSVTDTTNFHDALYEQTYPTGDLYYNNYYFIGHDERLRGGASGLEENPYFPYLKILDSQLNQIDNIQIQPGDTGFMHLHPFVAIRSEKLYFGWMKRIHIGANLTSLPCIEEYTLTISTGIKDNRNPKDNINVFPNPVTNDIEIEAPQNTNIEIMSSQGQIMESFVTKNTNTTIDISIFPCGIYFIKAKTANSITVKKLIKE